MFDRRQIDQSAAGHRPLRRVVRRQNLGLGLALKIGDLGLDLGAKLVRGLLELVQGLAHLPRDIRQLLWPKNKQRQHEQKSHLPKTEHASHHTAGVRSAATRAVSHLCFFSITLVRYDCGYDCACPDSEYALADVLFPTVPSFEKIAPPCLLTGTQPGSCSAPHVCSCSRSF